MHSTFTYFYLLLLLQASSFKIYFYLLPLEFYILLSNLEFYTVL